MLVVVCFAACCLFFLKVIIYISRKNCQVLSYRILITNRSMYFRTICISMVTYNTTRQKTGVTKMIDLLEEFNVEADFTSEMEEAYLLSDVMNYIKMYGYDRFLKQLNERIEQHYLEQMSSFVDSKCEVQHHGW